MKYQKYKFREYNKNYLLLYKKEERKLRQILTKSSVIKHVGSTAVPGLGGKGIIDIVIFIPKKDLKKNFKILEFSKFEYKPKAGDDKRKFFQKKIIYKGKERRIHVHLTVDKSVLNSFIAFRDYLKKDKKVREEYAQIKKKGAEKAKGDKTKYADYKINFLKNTIKSIGAKNK